jgi:hypothetical protein
LRAFGRLRRCRALRRSQRRPRPSGQILGIVKQPRRQLPVRVHSDRLGPRLILKRLRSLRFELRDRLFVGAKIKPRAQREREVGAVSGNAEAGKHPANGDRAEIGKQVDQEIAVHVSPQPRRQPRSSW